MSRPTLRRSSICFVALRAYGNLSGRGDIDHIGGAEVQQVLIARELVERGYRVSFVTLDVGQGRDEDLDGIMAYRAYATDSGWSGFRFFHPRLTGVWRAMRRANADIYYQRTSDTLTGLVCAFCRRRKKRFVFAVGHDADCDPALPHCPNRRERVPYLYGLVRADAVIAQTFAQQRNLDDHFGVHSIVIPSCALSPQLRSQQTSRNRPCLIWLGRFAPHKRLELLLDVASRCTEVDFHVLGDRSASDYVNGLKDRASRLTNLRLVGYVPHAELDQHYDRATALICTSVAEGFPNTFLEAWSRRIPVITSVDPDGVVARHRLGCVAEDVDALTNAVQTICFDKKARNRMAEAASKYFVMHHTVPVAVHAYERLLRGLMTPSACPRTATHPA